MSIIFLPYEIYRGINLDNNTEKLKVPEGVDALIYKHQNIEKPVFLKPGELIREKEGILHLIRNTPFEISSRFIHLKSVNGYAVNADLLVRFQLNRKGFSNHSDFIGNIVNNRDKVNISDIEAHIKPEFLKALDDYVKTREVSELVEMDQLPHIEAFLRNSLNRILISSGLEFLGLSRALFTSDDYNKLKFNEAEIQKEQNFEKQNKEMREIWNKIDKDEALEKLEFETFMKELEHKKIIQELRHAQEQYDEAMKNEEAYKVYQEQQFNIKKTLEKMELDNQLHIDRIKFQERLEQAKMALRELENAPTEYFISLIEDESMRAKLYEELIMQKMTPDQIKNMKMPEIDDRVDKKLRDFYEQIQKEINKGLQKSKISFVHENVEVPIRVKQKITNKTKRVLLPINRKVLAYQPGSLTGSETPKETYDFSKYELGSIRSAKVINLDGVDNLVAGARRGIYVTPLYDSTNKEIPHIPKKYALYTDKDFEGGVNSVAELNGYLWCTHSEGGIQRIDPKNQDLIAVPVLREITKKAKTIRSITKFNDKLFVILDNNILSFTPNSDGKVTEEPLKYEGATDEITSFVISESMQTITAGTRSGNMLRWDLGNPYIALQLPKQNNAVYMLKALKIASIDHMIFGNKQSGVLAMTLNNDLLDMQVVYKCKDKIRWVNGSDDFIFGATADINAVNIWRSDEFDHVMWRIEPGGKIQDIELWIENN